MTSTAVQESRTPATDAPVQWTLDGAVAVVTMTKPPHNLLDDAMLEALVAAYRAAVEAGARAILLRSALRHFCAGAEVETFGVTTVTHTPTPSSSPPSWRAWRAFRSRPSPL
jgi:enoyl-CoA hydratase/carnithine racemase